MTRRGQPSIFQTALMLLYELGWRMALPVLRGTPRLSTGLSERTARRPPPPADLWIHAASAGECRLAAMLLAALHSDRPMTALVTTNTPQGREILSGSIRGDRVNGAAIPAETRYLPFDRPTLMRTAVRSVDPRVMVLLESELWPGLLFALRRRGVRILVVNGRMTARGHRRYRRWRAPWRALRPDRILAVSGADADRFGDIFGPEGVSVMPNMKFDAVDPETAPDGPNPLSGIVPADRPFVVLGSVRAQEEGQVEQIIAHLRRRHPEAVIGLFPRHMHRLDRWRAHLHREGIPWSMRSRLRGDSPCATVLLWDTFGELPWAYRLAQAAFVGGSLAPLGGQNFLEALVHGVVPVIGPHWENFKWVGGEIRTAGLLRVERNWISVARRLLADLAAPADRHRVRARAAAYIQRRRGGTRIAREAVRGSLRRP